MPCWPRWRESRRRSWRSALDRLIAAGLLFRQGAPPHATYLFKHALVQDAAYGTLLREPRRALHARIAEAIESQFAEIAENQPELLARHCTEAGLIEKAADLVGQSGTAVGGAFGAGGGRRAAHTRACPDRDLARHARAASRADQASGRAHNPTHTSQRICSARKPRRRSERARLLIEQAESAGRACRRPLAVVLGPLRLLGRELRSVQRRRGARARGAVPGARRETESDSPAHDRASRSWAVRCCYTGDIAEGRAHYDQAIALYDPVEHRPLATRFGQDSRVAVLSYRSSALWLLGYPDAALADVERALEDAREIGQAATLMHALSNSVVHQYVSRELRGSKRASR